MEMPGDLQVVRRVITSHPTTRDDFHDGISDLTGRGRLPEGVTTRYVIGAGTLGGVGFTVSLFVTELAFGEEVIGTDARLGVLIGSLVAALIGSAIIIPGSLENDRSMDGNRERSSNAAHAAAATATASID